MAAAGLAVENPTIVVASHSLFMMQFYSVVADEGGEAPFYHNTGIACYRIAYTTDGDRGGGGNCHRVEEVRCEVRSCAKHLENQDDSYEGGYGGCCLEEPVTSD